MDKNELYEIVENMAEILGADNLLNALCMSLGSDTLENHLRYINRVYETNCF